MTHISLKKNKGNIDTTVFHRKGDKAMYNNVIDKDAKKLAQVLMDLHFLGFPIFEAVEILKKRYSKKDWFGF